MVATNAAGNVVWKESYRPYGDKLRNEPASRNDTNKIGYAGSPFDAGTGLSYMGARYYDPVIGRFMGIDPVGFQEDNIHSFNRYAYANNNPYKFVDRDGRIALPLLLGIGVLATGGVINAFQPPEKQLALAARLQRALDNIFRSDSAESQPAGGSESGGEPRAGESGGPGAGKAFGDKTKDEIRDRDGNKCVFCKKDTTREPGPDQSNIDHAKPKADDGNNTTNNGQNTCRTCNLDKGRRSTGEFLESGGRRFPQQYGSQP